jgi:hypothetical protein
MILIVKHAEPFGLDCVWNRDFTLILLLLGERLYGFLHERERSSSFHKHFLFMTKGVLGEVCVDIQHPNSWEHDDLEDTAPG